MITMRSMYPLLLLLCVVQGYTLEMNNSSAVQTILPLLKSFIPRRAIIVPLGNWTAQDYVSLCNTDFSFGCARVENFTILLDHRETRLPNGPVTSQWRLIRRLAAWTYTSPKPPVSRHDHKVFIINSPQIVSMAQDICDTDFYRHCLGIFISTSEKSPAESHYMPMVSFYLKNDYAHISATHPRCLIHDRNVGLYNLVTDEILLRPGHEGSRLAWLTNCQRTMKKKTVSVNQAMWQPTKELQDKAVQRKGKLDVGHNEISITVWTALTELLGMKLDVRYPLPEGKFTSVGPLHNRSYYHKERLLMIHGITDVVIFTMGSFYTINHGNGDLHPYLRGVRYMFRPTQQQYACPMPKKLPSLYNILTPLSYKSWIAVLVAYIAACAVSILIGQVYKRCIMALKRESKTEWYYIPIFTLGIIFAEGYPSSWENKKGVARRILNEFWKLAAMLIVFIYLCNLRSHLIRGVYEDSPSSFEDFLLPKFSSMKAYTFIFDYLDPTFKPLVDQDRFVNISVTVSGKEANKIVKNGDCGVGYRHLFIEQEQSRALAALKLQEWFNQKREGKHYYHRFDLPVYQENYYGWFILTTNPYMSIYIKGMMLVEQAGITEMLARQRQPMRARETESKLEPLKLEHFHITLFGNAAGAACALIIFLIERVVEKK